MQCVCGNLSSRLPTMIKGKHAEGLKRIKYIWTSKKDGASFASVFMDSFILYSSPPKLSAHYSDGAFRLVFSIKGVLEGSQETKLRGNVTKKNYKHPMLCLLRAFRRPCSIHVSKENAPNKCFVFMFVFVI